MTPPAAAARAPAAHLAVEEIAEPEALEALEPEWSALFDACPQASPFQSPEWLLAWRQAFLREGLWTLAVRRAGRLVALLPLFLYRAPGGGRQLTLLGNGVSDRLDLLALAEEAEAAAEAACAHLAARRGLWDCADWRDLPADSPLLRAALPGAMEEVEADEPCPAAPLPADPEAVVTMLEPRRRADLSRCGRRLAETGEVRVRLAREGELDEALAELIRLHEVRWRARGEPGVLADPAVQAFHRAAVAALHRRGLLRLRLLELDGHAIAAQYALQRGATGYSYLTAFDPAFARFSPGLLLCAHTLQAAAREGARRFDFLRGREAYKHLWGAVDQPQWRRRFRPAVQAAASGAPLPAARRP